MKKKIILIDDEPLILSLMKEVIEQEEDLEVAAMVGEKEKFLDLIFHQSFDVAIIDISVGGREGGLEILQISRAKGLSMPFIVLSAHDELDYALKCLKAGAQGYINKNYICSDIAKGLKTVMDGQLFISGENGPYLLKQFQKPSL